MPRHLRAIGLPTSLLASLRLILMLAAGWLLSAPEPAWAQGPPSSQEEPENGDGDPELDDEANNDEEEGDEDEEDEDGDPVDLSSGAFTFSRPVLRIPGRGLDVNIGVSYQSDKAGVPSQTGSRWVHSFEQKIVLMVTKLPPIRPYPGPSDLVPNGPGGGDTGGTQPGGGPGDGASAGPGGSGWSGDLLYPLKFDVFHYHDLRIDHYVKPFGESLWVGQNGAFRKLTHTDSPPPDRIPQAFTLRLADGTIYDFDLREGGDCFATESFPTYTYRPSRIQDRAGNRIALNYEVLSKPSTCGPTTWYRRLQAIDDTYDRTVQFDYDEDGWLETITDYTGRIVTLEHDDHGNLTALVLPQVAADPSRWEFEYDPPVVDQAGSGHLLLKVFGPREVASANPVPYIENIYGDSNRVVRQYLGGTNDSGIPAGGIYDYLYDHQPSQPEQQTIDHGWFQEESRTAVIDPNGNVRMVIYDDHDRKRLSYLFSGRVTHAADVSGQPSVNQLISVEPGTWPPVLANNVLLGASPPLGSHEPGSHVRIRRVDYNSDNLMVLDEGQDYRATYVYDSSPDLYQRQNLLVEQHESLAQPGNVITRAYAYEPMYNGLRVGYDPRGLGAYTPPHGGAATPDRYARFRLFDYQEGPSNALNGMVSKWEIDVAQASSQSILAGYGISLSPVNFNVPDAAGNNDGVIDQRSGNLIRVDVQVRRLDDAHAGTFVDDRITIRYQYNDYSQRIAEIDPAGFVDRYEYYPLSDPGGGGGSGSSPNGGGFLASLERASGQPEATLVQYGYDDLGRRTSMVNQRGFVSTWLYNDMDDPVLYVDPVGRQTTYAYDADLNLAAKWEDNQRPELDAGFEPTGQQLLSPPIHTVYTSDILGNVVQEDVHVLDQGTVDTTRFRYDRCDNRVLILAPEWEPGSGNLRARVFDEFRQLWTESRGGVPAEFIGLAAHADIPELADLPVDPTDLATTRRFYAASHQVRFEDAESNPTHFHYDGFNRLVCLTDALGNETRTTYDPAGNVTTVQTFDDTGALLAEIRHAFDELDRDFQIDQRFFDENGQDLADGPLTPGDGLVTTRRVFDARGDLAYVVDDNGKTVTSQYDGLSRIQHSIDSVGNETYYRYDATSNLIHLEEHEFAPDGTEEVYHTWNFHDENNRLVAEVDNLGHATRYLYDIRGNLVFESDAESVTLGLPLASLDDYNQFGDLTGPGLPTINGHGNVQVHTYDDAGRPKSTMRVLRDAGLGGNPVDGTLGAGDGLITTTRDYDQNGRLIGQTDDNGHTTAHFYDDLDRRTSTRFADNSEESCQFDRNGNRKLLTDANGTEVTFQYDPLQRLIRKDVQPANGVQGTTFEDFDYDGLSRMILARNDDCEVIRAYDSLNHMVLDSIDGVATRLAHDGVGNLRREEYPGGRTVTKEYDAMNRLEEIWDAAGPTLVADYEYVGAHRVATRSHANGTVSTRLYDGVRRSNGTVQNGPSGTFDQRSFAFGRVHQKLSRLNLLSGLGHSYTYDSTYRMTRTSRTGGGHPSEIINTGLDGVGNRTSVSGGPLPGSYTQDVRDGPVNQYTRTPGERRSYDHNGNLKRRRVPAGPDIARMTYDYRNRMIEFLDSPTGQRHTFQYDALGRRVARVVDADGPAPSETRYYYSLGERVIEERDGTGTVRRDYVYGRFLDEAVQMRVYTPTFQRDYYYHTDEMYNVVALTDAVGGLIEAYDYGDFGQVLNAATLAPLGSSSVGNPYFFNSRRRDSETDLYHYRRRYMDPHIGRFTTRDPIGIWGDALNTGNGYTYANHNPWSMLDPTGTHSWFEHFADGAKADAYKERFKAGVDGVLALIGVPTSTWTSAVRLGKTAFESLITLGMSTAIHDRIAQGVVTFMGSIQDSIRHIGNQIGAGSDVFATVRDADGNIIQGQAGSWESSIGSGYMERDAAGQYSGKLQNNQIGIQGEGTPGNPESQRVGIYVTLEDGTKLRQDINPDGTSTIIVSHEDTKGRVMVIELNKNNEITSTLTFSRRYLKMEKALEKRKRDEARKRENEASKNNRGDTRSSKNAKTDCDREALKGDTGHWGSVSGNPRPSSS